MSKLRKVEVGDVVQILTSEGVCYALVINKHEEWGSIIAVFREFPNQRPEDFTPIFSGSPQFITAFLLQHAVDQGLFSIVSNVPVPEHLQEFPTFRSTNHLKGEATMWFFWSGEREVKINRPLTKEEFKYPKGPSWPSAPRLLEMIQSNYRVEVDYI